MYNGKSLQLVVGYVMNFMSIKNEVSCRKGIARQHSRHKSIVRAEGMVDPVNPNSYTTEAQGITCQWLDGAMVIAFYRNYHEDTNSPIITLRASCGAVYCNRSCLWVCVFVFVGLLPR